jgi:acyl-coenzyme A thioesterase 13
MPTTAASKYWKVLAKPADFQDSACRSTRQKEVTRMSEIPQGFKPSGFAGKYLGMVGPYFTKSIEDSILVGLRIEEQHINYVDIAHGGVLATLADVSLSLQAHRAEDPPLNATTISLTTNFLGPAKLGDWLEARGQIDRMGKRVCYTSGAIRAGEKVIMTMTGVFNIMR